MNYDLNNCLRGSFVLPSTHLWNKDFIEDTIAFLRGCKSINNKISNERPFTEFLLEVEEAYRSFLKKINDLPMIMKCRVKGDNDAHFGGQECADFVRALRNSAEKYLKSTNFKKENIDAINSSQCDSSNVRALNGLYDFILKIRDRARIDEQVAKNIESEVYNDYLSLGKDHTLDALKSEGYTFNND